MIYMHFCWLVVLFWSAHLWSTLLSVSKSNKTYFKRGNRLFFWISLIFFIYDLTFLNFSIKVKNPSHCWVKMTEILRLKWNLSSERIFLMIRCAELSHSFNIHLNHLISFSISLQYILINRFVSVLVFQIRSHVLGCLLELVSSFLHRMWLGSKLANGMDVMTKKRF